MISEGSLFTLTSGRFSSRPGAHIVRALVELDLDALEQTYRASLDTDDEVYGYLFVKWLLDHDLIEAVDHLEVYLGDRNDHLRLETEPPFRSLEQEIDDAFWSNSAEPPPQNSSGFGMTSLFAGPPLALPQFADLEKYTTVVGDKPWGPNTPRKPDAP